MTREKTPLPELVERGRVSQNGFGWVEFMTIAKLSHDKRMSFKSLGNMFNRNERTMKRWLQRYEKEYK